MTVRLSTANSDSLLSRLLAFVAPPDPSDSHRIHGLHPYPAKFIPQLPRAVITSHTNERHVVLDPFCGSGTTLVEAALLGRKSIGIDSNPIACLITRAKTTPLSAQERLAASTILMDVASLDQTTLPPFDEQVIANQALWFQQNMARELAWLKNRILQVSEPLRSFLFCVFSSIIVSASNQDSETRYKSVDKGLPNGFAIERFQKKLRTAIDSAASYFDSERAKRNVPRVILSPTEQVDSTQIKSNSVDLVVTSPPYPNSFDYYLYHKLRMAWLGFDYRIAQAQEIGSRYEHSSRRAGIDIFCDRMLPALRNISRILKPSKLAYFFVGDAVIAGKSIDMTELYVSLGQQVGLKLVGETAYDLGAVSRSFKDTRAAAGNSHRHQKLQRVLVFECINLQLPAAGLRKVASPIPSNIPCELNSQVLDGATIALRSIDSDRHIHSLAWFPSKYIPEVPRWAISHYCPQDLIVLDPFGGSGTTAVEAVLIGQSAISVDINPYACLIAKAKTTVVQTEQLKSVASRFEAVLNDSSRLPTAKRLYFPLDDFWFHVPHLHQFATLLAWIDQEVPTDLKAFFQVVLASTIRGFSYQDSSQIKVKRDPRKVSSGTPPPIDLVRKRLPWAISRMLEFLEKNPRAGAVKVVCASADDFLAHADLSRVGLVVTSPPYINAMNYPMATRYELILLGLIPIESFKVHEAAYFGSERVYAREYQVIPQIPVEWPNAEDLNIRLARIFEHEPKRSLIVAKYFLSMAKVFASLIAGFKSGSSIVLVAGSNVIRGVELDTFSHLLKILEYFGFRRSLSFRYEIVKQALKLTRHQTASIIPHDGVAVLEKP